jgi:23S rRNA (adenine2503-C2)-methyltransferase
VDILALTFDELIATLRPPRRDVPHLRRAYKRAMRAETPHEPLEVNVAPVVREVRDGELTKFVQRTADGLETESVLVPMQGRHREWKSVCVSTQVGCAMGCVYCETAQLGFRRNLTAGEIVGQVVAARRLLGTQADTLRNVVFMGMGEPFNNFDNVVQAIRVLCDQSGLSIGKPRITISTVGRTEGIRRLGELRWLRFNLAVSLNAPNDEIRSYLMPINRTEPMARLREALLAYPLRSCGFIMIEYVLIPGVNDAREHAMELVEYLRPVKCCVNVIPYNPRRESPWPAPSEESVGQFLEWLEQGGQFCRQRITKGRDHMAACGQLGNRALARTR